MMLIVPAVVVHNDHAKYIKMAVSFDNHEIFVRSPIEVWHVAPLHCSGPALCTLSPGVVQLSASA